MLTFSEVVQLVKSHRCVCVDTRSKTSHSVSCSKASTGFSSRLSCASSSCVQMSQTRKISTSGIRSSADYTHTHLDEYSRLLASNVIRAGSDEAKSLDSDRVSYVNKTRAWAIEQILIDHPDIFPGAAEEAAKVFNQIFQRDEYSNIVPYEYRTHFGADARDSEYLECLLYMPPVEAKRVYKLRFNGQAAEYSK